MKKKSPTKKGDVQPGYAPFLQGILTKIQEARYDMLMSVSRQMVLLYWDIGRAVSAKMQLAGWGQSVVERLAKDLQTEIPGVRGFSARNIWRMKTFSEFYAALGISATTVAEIKTRLVSATVVAEKGIEKSQLTTLAPNSAITVAELQPLVVEWITSIGWVQNCIIIEKLKQLGLLERKGSDKTGIWIIKHGA